MLIRDVLSGTVDETMRAPKLFAFIDKIRFHNYDASVTLKDTSGRSKEVSSVSSSLIF